MNIAIVGTGHVGLVTGACFADLGNRVLCMDHDQTKIQLLQKGNIPFFEPGLAELIQKNIKQKRLFFSTQMKDAVKFGKVVFLCVGTPPRSTGEADLSAIENVCEQIANHLTQYRLIVEKSTVPVETGAQLKKRIKQSVRRQVSFDVASNSEFLREGSAVQDFFKPDRIVLGVENERSRRILLELYKPFNVPIVVTNVEGGELIKHACNSFLAAKISFVNLVSQVCEKVGADIEKVAEGVGSDRRIGRAFLNAGIGYGGSCFPKDVQAFIKICEKLEVDANFLKGVERINESQKKRFVEKVHRAMRGVKGKTLGVLGLAFKPDTDDMRCAPSVDILTELKQAGAKIIAYDPQAMEAAKVMLNDVSYAKTPYEVCKGADALLILTEWREFRELDLKQIKKLLKHPIIIDGRNIYDPIVPKRMGFQYYSIGRKGFK